MTRSPRLAAAVALIQTVALSAAAAATQQAPSSSPATQEAQETFQARCSTCHADHGEGSDVGASLNVPDLRSNSVQKNDNTFLREFIKVGKGNMPAFSKDFSDAEIDRIVQLIRSFPAQAK